jgi:Bardet-Biedl syndrome 2 protein
MKPYITFQALVGYEGSQHYHVFELTRQLPRFAMYAVLVERTQGADSFVSFVITERLQRVSKFCEIL